MYTRGQSAVNVASVAEARPSDGSRKIARGAADLNVCGEDEKRTLGEEQETGSVKRPSGQRRQRWSLSRKFPGAVTK
jgi:hypothetical protein